SCGVSSRVTVSAVAGTAYLIRVSGWNGASGAFVLHVALGQPTERDDCSLATVITDGGYSGTTVGATNDGSACGSSDTSADVWFRYTAPIDGRLRVDTCPSSFD